MKFKPNADYIYVLKCTHLPVHEDGDIKLYDLGGGIVAPDDYGERTCFAEILSVGPEVEGIGPEHYRRCAVMCPEYGRDMSRVGLTKSKEDFVVRQSALRHQALFYFEE